MLCQQDEEGARIIVQGSDPGASQDPYDNMLPAACLGRWQDLGKRQCQGPSLPFSRPSRAQARPPFGTGMGLLSMALHFPKAPAGACTDKQAGKAEKVTKQ